MKRLMIGAAAALALAGAAFGATLHARQTEARWELRWPPQGDFVTVDGTRVHYLQQGSGPDVVLIHGAWGNLRDFSFSLMDRLVAQGFRVTAFDRPGLGYTGRTDPALDRAFASDAESPQAQAALLAQAAERIGVARPVVVGHSYGGSVAMAWALDHDAAAVVSLAGAIMPWPGGLDTTYEVLGSALGGALIAPLVTAFIGDDRLRRTVARTFEPQAMPEGYADHFGAALALRRDAMRANARQVKGLKPHVERMSSRYPTLELPVEILHGTADTTVGIDVHSDPAVNRLPNAALTTLDGVGHMPHHAREGAAVEAVRRAATRAGLR